MKLVLREFISMLKESGELDKIIPDLLQNMGITPISRAQVGVRQHGVDVAARGIDPEDNINKLFLVTIKPGDLTRNDWHSTPQSVKPSLEEIIEVYLPKKVSNKDQSIKKKIILCCGGDLKQEVHENWNGFVEKNENEKLEIEFWGADKLSDLIDKYFLDEYLFPESAQKQMRKTLSLIGDNDYDLFDYYKFISQTLSNLANSKAKLSQKKVLKALRLFNLSINLVSNWAKEEKSYKKSYLASERLMLFIYKFLSENKLLNKKRIKESYVSIYVTHINIETQYFLNIENHLYIKDSFFGYGADKYDYPLRTFEVIGTIATIGLDYVNLSKDYYDSKMDKARTIAKGLKSLIENNSAYSPLYDRNVIDIVLGLKLLYITDNKEECVKWIESILTQILLSIQFGEFFPINSDSYDDLLSVEKSKKKLKTDLTNVSSLIPILFQWFIILERKDLYQKYQVGIAEHYPHTDFQIWYPDKDLEKYMFDQNAGYQCGITLSSIELPDDFEKFVQLTYEALEWDNSLKYISSFTYNPTLLMISSRHFKMPLPPIFWQELFPNLKVRQDMTGLTTQ